MGKRDDISKALIGWKAKPRGGDRIAQKALPKAEPMAVPTIEQAARCEFVRGQIRDEGRYVGFAYRRRPLMESRADKIGLDAAQLSALRYYRNAYERADSSPVKCSLDVGVGGGGGNGTESRALTAIENSIGARWASQRCEAAIGNLVDTVRAVAVFDLSFSDVAIARWGSRSQAWLVDETVSKVTGKVRKVFRERIIPRSGKHRALIAEEFMEGTRRLTALVGGSRSVAGTGNVSGPVVKLGAAQSLGSQISAAVARHEEATSIWMAEATLFDLMREAGLDAVDAPDGTEEIAGVPIIIKSNWVWGWLLCVAAPAEGTCAGAQE